MLKVWLYMNIQKSKFYDLPTPEWTELVKGLEMQEILKFVPFRLLK